MSCFEVWSLIISFSTVLAVIAIPVVQIILNFRRKFDVRFIVDCDKNEIDTAQLRINVANPNIQRTKYIEQYRIEGDTEEGGKYRVPYNIDLKQYEISFDGKIVVKPLQLIRLPGIQIDGHLRRSEIKEGSLLFHLTDESGKTRSYDISRPIRDVIDRLKKKEIERKTT